MNTPQPPADAYPLVTVVVPVFNQEQFVAQSLGSVLRQSYRRLQVIVADDASTDGTLDVVRKIQRSDPNRIEVLDTPHNLGITKNALRTVPHIRGRYVVWFAGDDLMYPEKIGRQVERLEAEKDAVICYHDAAVFDSKSETLLYCYNDALVGHTAFSGDIVQPLLLYRCFINGVSAMLRVTDPFTGHDPRIPIASDWLLFIRAAMIGRAIYIPETLAAYRRHPGNITGREPTYDEEILTYAIVGQGRPDLLPTIERGKARTYLFYAAKFAARGSLRPFIASIAQLLATLRRAPQALPFVASSVRDGIRMCAPLPFSHLRSKHRQEQQKLRKVLDELRDFGV